MAPDPLVAFHKCGVGSVARIKDNWGPQEEIGRKGGEELDEGRMFGIKAMVAVGERCESGGQVGGFVHGGGETKGAIEGEDEPQSGQEDS